MRIFRAEKSYVVQSGRWYTSSLRQSPPARCEWAGRGLSCGLTWSWELMSWPMSSMGTAWVAPWAPPCRTLWSFPQLIHSSPASTCASLCPPISDSTFPPTHLPILPCILPSLCPRICPSIIHLSIQPSVCPFIHPSHLSKESFSHPRCHLFM